MPTAARLIAALSLAALAFVVSQQVMSLLPEGTYFGNFVIVNIVIGLLVGWVVMGRRAGRGLTPALNNGLTGVVVLVFWGLLVQGINEMVELALRNRYGGPFEAIIDVFRIGAEYGELILDKNILITLAIGAVLSGLATEAAARMWR